MIENKKTSISDGFFIIYIIGSCASVVLLSLTINYFVVPSYDDYYFATFDADRPFFEELGRLYVYLSPRLLTNFTLAFLLNKVVSFEYYGLAMAAMNVVVLLMTIYMASLFFVGKKRALLFGSLFYAFLWSGTPSLASNFYWMSALVAYTLSIAVVMSLTVFAFEKYSLLSGKSFAVLLALMCAAMLYHEIITVYFMMTFVFISVKILYTEKRLNARYILIFLACSIGASICLLSPGNAGRSAYFAKNSHNLAFSINSACMMCLKHSIEWIIGIRTLLLALVCIYLIDAKHLRRDVVGRLRQFTTVFFGMSIILPFITFFIYAWVSGSHVIDRVLGLAYVMFNLLFFLSVILWRSGKEDSDLIWQLLDKRVLAIAFSMAVLASPNVWKTSLDLATKASAVKKYSDARHAFFMNPTTDKVSVMTYPAFKGRPPHSIPMMELSADPAKYPNRRIAKYYRYHGRDVAAVVSFADSN